jgi:VCBS repeat-containing protein
VEVYDGQETATDTAFVAVKNVAPAVAITGVPESNPEGMPISLGSGVTEPGSADTHTYAWSVTKNGDDYRSGGNADFNFTPNDNGSYVVSIVVTDDDGGEGTASVTIEVANVPPTASVDEASVDEDGPPLDIAVLGNDSDPAGIRDPLTIIGVDTQVTVGSVAWTAAGVTYNPDGKFEPLGVGETATDTFAYTIDDGDGGTDTATVTVTIEGQNDAPTVVNPIADVTAMEDGPDTSTDVSGVFADVDADDTLVLSVYSSNSTLLIAAVVGNVLTLDYLPDRSGSTTITVRATDAAGAFVENAFTVTVLSASQQIQQILMPQVQALVESGVLNGGQGNSLISKLAGAQGQLDQGNVNAGVNKLGAFINEVKALVKSRRLTSQQGQNLIEAAEAAINSAQPAADAAGAALAALGKSDRSSNSWLHPLDSSLLDELVAASSQKSGKGTSNK